MEDSGALGDLHVQLVKAEGLRDTALFGVQDPYVLVRFGQAVLKSRTDKDGGTNPVWNERLSLLEKATSASRTCLRLDTSSLMPHYSQRTTEEEVQ